MKYSINNVGRKITLNDGSIVECIDGGSKRGHILIKITGGIKDYVTEIQISQFNAKTIKNKYIPSIYGKGYIGEGKHKAKVNGKKNKAYNVWNSMMQRVYDEKYLEKKPSYRKVKICKEWHNFQNFAEWFEKNYIDGFQLDKDLLSNDELIYSPETCCFLPSVLNNSIILNRIGVYYSNFENKYIAQIQIGTRVPKKIGRFDTKEEAIKAFKIEKRKRLDYLIDKYENILDKKAIDAIRKFKENI